MDEKTTTVAAQRVGSRPDERRRVCYVPHVSAALQVPGREIRGRRGSDVCGDRRPRRCRAAGAGAPEQRLVDDTGCDCQPFPLRRFVDTGQQDGSAEPESPDGRLRPCNWPTPWPKTDLTVSARSIMALSRLSPAIVNAGRQRWYVWTCVARTLGSGPRA